MCIRDRSEYVGILLKECNGRILDDECVAIDLLNCTDISLSLIHILRILCRIEKDGCGLQGFARIGACFLQVDKQGLSLIHI